MTTFNVESIKTVGGFRLGDQVRNIDCNWQGRVTGFDTVNGDEMLVCHHVCGGEIELDDKRWFSPEDMRLVNDVPDPHIAMRAIRIVFADPTLNFGTDINGTRAEICKYYNRPISVGTSETDERFAKPIAIEFFDTDGNIRVEL